MTLWVLAAALAAAAWSAALFALASLGGWRSMARLYRAEGKPSGKDLNWRTCSLGGARYRGCIHFCVGGQGLYFAPAQPLRPFHPALRIPWAHVRLLETREGAAGGAVLSLGTPETSRLVVPMALFDEMKGYLGFTDRRRLLGS